MKSSKKAQTKALTGMAGFNEIVSGDMAQEGATLLAGSLGSGKATLGAAFRGHDSGACEPLRLSRAHKESPTVREVPTKLKQGNLDAQDAVIDEGAESPKKELAVTQTEAAPTFKFCLYIADDTSNSAQAIANLRALCDEYLPGRHEITLINVMNDPDRARKERIFLTPMLVKLEPAPPERIVGTLSQTDLVLQTLGIRTSLP